jgi:hypothetical protein
VWNNEEVGSSVLYFMHVHSVESVLKIIRSLSTTSAIPVDFVSDKTNLLYLEQRDISSNYR